MKKIITTILILGAISVASAKIDRNLTIGSRGEDVKELQAKLGIDQTGYFGNLTKKAVISWQKQNNLSATGYFGVMSRGIWNTPTTPIITQVATPTEIINQVAQQKIQDMIDYQNLINKYQLMINNIDTYPDLDTYKSQLATAEYNYNYYSGLFDKNNCKNTYSGDEYINCSNYMNKISNFIKEKDNYKKQLDDKKTELKTLFQKQIDIYKSLLNK